MSNGQSRFLIGTALIALIGICIYFVIRGSAAQVGFPDRYTLHGACLACKREVKLTVGVRELPPFTCSECKQKAVFAWMYCSNCKRRFIPSLPGFDKNGNPLPPSPPKCTGCGSRFIEAYIPNLITQSPVGDAAFPKWTGQAPAKPK